MAVPYNQGGISTGIPSNTNFIAAFDALMPDVDSKLTMRYGDQLLTGLLDMVGNKTATTRDTYEHYEDRRYMPLIKATNGGAGSANASVTFTFDASAISAIAQDSDPFPSASTVTKNGVPAVPGMIVLIKPASGAVDPTTYVQAIITAVDPAAGTFAASPVVAGDAIPAVTSADEIIIISNAYGNGSAMPESMDTGVDKYTNNTQIFKGKWKINKTARNSKLWFEIRNPETGQAGHYWTYKGEKEAYFRFLNYREMGMLLGENLTNVTLFDIGATAGTPNKITQGLIPTILSGGNTQNYSSISGLTYADFENMVTVLDKQKGAKNNLLMAGINLSLQIDREFRGELNNGAVTYGNFTFNEDLAVNFQFSKLKIGEYVFNKKTYDAFNDRNTLGADGYNFPYEGMVIPMDTQADAQSGEEIPSLRTRYLASPDQSREMDIIYFDGLKQSDTGSDTEEVRYQSECGLETFGIQRFTYIKKAG